MIITHNRPELLAQTACAVDGQVEEIIVLDNASDPPVDLRHFEYCLGSSSISVTYIPTQPPNLSELWLEGIKQAESMGGRYVGFLCDDAPPPAGWYDAMVNAIKETGAAIAAPGNVYFIRTEPDRDIAGRMPGWAFVLDIQTPVRPDPSMAWWWLDTDLDFQARKNGGMVTVPGFYVHNVHPNEYTYLRPWAADQIGADTRAFEAKWGPRPW